MSEYPLLSTTRLMVLAPHPDDETLACGGTLALLSRAGAATCVVVVSDGGAIPLQIAPPADIVAARASEARAATTRLGVSALHFLNFPDGGLKKHTTEIEAAVDGLVMSFRPEIVMAPTPLDHHDDHIALSHAAIAVAQRHPELRLAMYQVYSTLRFDTLVEISDVLATKNAALRAYRYSLLFGDPETFIEAAQSLARYWSLYRQRLGYYEAFLVLPPVPLLGDILAWLTYGAAADPAALAVKQLTAVDELLFALKQSEDEIHSLRAEVERLRHVVTPRGVENL